MADYYAALGVARDASADDIKRAFRRIARESHPDANPGDPSAEDRFRRAAEAYEVLSDPARRAAYDRGDTADFGDLFSSFAGVEDLLQRFFGAGFGGFGGVTRNARGGDLLRSVTVSLAEAAAGTEREVSYRSGVRCDTCSGSGAEPGTTRETCERCGGSGAVRVTRQTMLGATMTVAACDGCSGSGSIAREPCTACRGRGSTVGERSVTVEVPAGIADGNRLRVSGGGDAGGPGEPFGDLYVDIVVEPDPRFGRAGDDLVHRLTIGVAEAALGTTVQIPRIDGVDDEDLEIEAGTQPGTVIRMPRLGMPRLRGRGYGDLLVEVVVEVPASLTPEQEEAMRAYAAATGESPAEPKRRRRKR